MDKLYGWIIQNGHLNSDKFSDYAHWLKQAAENRGMKIDIVTNDDILVTNNKTNPLYFSKKTRKLALPNFIHYADKDLHLARQLEVLGIPLFNSAEAIAICDNKSVMHQHLFKKAIPTPETVLAPMVYSGIEVKEISYIEAVIDTLGLPLIVKEAYGSFGQQVYWAETMEDLTRIAKNLAGKEHLFQKPVHTSLGKDIRINVIGGKAVAAMTRTSETDFRANVTAGGTTSSYDPSPEETMLAINAAAAVGADFAGVDLLIADDAPVVCEVNSNPHIRSIYECTGIDVATPMIQHIYQTLTDRKERSSS